MNMGLTVEKLVKRLLELDCKLIAGEAGIKNEILVVDGMEVPDIAPWLMKGELLTTTGYSIRDKKNGLLELVRSLKDADAAAMVLKTRFLGEVSPEVVAEANALNIPIIQTPNNMSFAEIKRIVYSLLLEEENEKYSYRERIQNEFFKIKISDGGFQRICDKFSEISSLSMAIIDYTDIMLAKSRIKNIFADFVMEEFIQDPGYSSFKYSADKKGVFKFGEARCHICKIYVQNIVCGYVVVDCESAALDENAQVVLNYACEAVSLEYLKMQTVKRNNSVLNDDLFVDIIMENVKNSQAANYRAQSLNWPRLPLFLVLFDIDNFQDFIKTKSELEIRHVKNRIIQIISNCAVYQNMSNTVFSKGDLFFLISSEKVREEIQKAVDKILKIVKEDLRIDMTAGCVKNIEEYMGIKSAHKEAQDTIEICRKKYGGGNFLFSEDVLLEHSFLSNRNIFLNRFVENTVNKLVEYDDSHNTDLYYVLKTLAKNMGVRTKTAEALFVHRNTLSYKIAKIERILNVNLSESDELLKLFIGIFVKELL